MRAASAPKADFRPALRLVRRSRYLTAIASLIWLSAFVTTIAGWQFKAIAKDNIPATDELAMFFGSFNMLAGLIALALRSSPAAFSSPPASA